MIIMYNHKWLFLSFVTFWEQFMDIPVNKETSLINHASLESSNKESINQCTDNKSRLLVQNVLKYPEPSHFVKFHLT